MFFILSICKGGGYMYCRTIPSHPKANSKGLYPLHRVIVENTLGRLLNDGEEVHHKNGNKDDNSIENLEVLSKSEHARLHRTKPLISLTCPKCFTNFHLSSYTHRTRKNRNKSGLVFCSMVCSNRYFNFKK